MLKHIPPPYRTKILVAVAVAINLGLFLAAFGSETFWYEYGSADPYLGLTDPGPTPDPAPDPGIFVSDLQDDTTKDFFSKFFCLLLFEATFTSFFKIKKSNRSHQTAGIKIFLTIFA
jgi:hypothetical protein